MVYNFSGMANQTSIVGALKAANGFTNNLLGIFMLAAVGLALFFTLRRENSNRVSFAAAMFAITILSALMGVLGLVSIYVPGACVVILILTGVFLIVN